MNRIYHLLISFITGIFLLFSLSIIVETLEGSKIIIIFAWGYLVLLSTIGWCYIFGSNKKGEGK